MKIVEVRPPGTVVARVCADETNGTPVALSDAKPVPVARGRRVQPFPPESKALGNDTPLKIVVAEDATIRATPAVGTAALPQSHDGCRYA